MLAEQRIIMLVDVKKWSNKYITNYVQNNKMILGENTSIGHKESTDEASDTVALNR